jgi:hypothetical protein
VDKVYQSGHICVQVLEEWQIPYMAITNPNSTEAELKNQLESMVTAPKVFLVSITCMAEEEIQRFLRQQPIAIVAVDEAQAYNHLLSDP